MIEMWTPIDLTSMRHSIVLLDVETTGLNAKVRHARVCISAFLQNDEHSRAALGYSFISQPLQATKMVEY